MKKTIIILSIIFIAIILFAGTLYKNIDKSYLRIHIRANSNTQIDQNIKYKIKDNIVEALTPIVVECGTFDEVKNVLNDNLTLIDDIANKTLTENGFKYKAKSKLVAENFPTRKYNEFVLEEGIYDALIVELGEAKGDNWWCVIYPPLCFTSTKSGNNVVYKSRIIEMIKKWSGENY